MPMRLSNVGILGLEVLSILAVGADAAGSCAGSSNTTYSAVITSLGCYTDNETRTLDGREIVPGNLNSPEYCTTLCGELGYKYAGTEYTTFVMLQSSIVSE
jgi:xylan 1,4-beta-xylosidase